MFPFLFYKLCIIWLLNLANCIELKYLKGLEKMLDLREIDLTGCTSFESLHA